VYKAPGVTLGVPSFGMIWSGFTTATCHGFDDIKALGVVPPSDRSEGTNSQNEQLIEDAARFICLNDCGYSRSCVCDPAVDLFRQHDSELCAERSTARVCLPFYLLGIVSSKLNSRIDGVITSITTPP